MPSVAEEYHKGVEAMRGIHDQSVYFSGITATRNTDYLDTEHYTSFLRVQYNELARVRNTNGIGQYAKDVTGEPGAELLADYNAIQAQIDVICQMSHDNTPKEPGGVWAEVVQVNADGTWTRRSFTPTQTSSLRAEADILASLIPSYAFRQT